MKTIYLKTFLAANVFAVLPVGSASVQQDLPKPAPAVPYNFVKIDGLNIFHREAGDRRF